MQKTSSNKEDGLDVSGIATQITKPLHMTRLFFEEDPKWFDSLSWKFKWVQDDNPSKLL